MALVVLPQEEKAANKNTNQVISGGAISYSSFTLSKLVVFAGVFALLGGYWLFSSFALGPQLALIEAETMVVPATSTFVNDNIFSAGRAVNLTQNGKLSKTFSTSTVATHVAVIAGANACRGSYATIQVLIDNKLVLGPKTLADNSYKSYVAELAMPLPAGTHSIDIVYNEVYTNTNPQDNRCNRSLTTDAIKIYGTNN
jgi:hypothetical protein